MKRILHFIPIVIVIASAAGCGGSSSNGGNGPVTGTSMAGTWTATGSLANQGGPHSYQVKLVSSACSVTTPVGTFTVQGPVCFIANNNSGNGSITGGSTTAASAGQGVLIGVAADPAPANAKFNLVFVAGYADGTFAEFTGSGTVGDKSLTGTGACSSTTPVCQGMTGSFTGTLQ
jgi:hypothetical protein